MLHYGNKIYPTKVSNPQVEERSEDCDDRNAQEVVIVAGEVLEGALATDTEYDGNYPNHACQNWNIVADENQVYLSFKTKIPSILGI